jgi:hypothetical protein
MQTGDLLDKLEALGWLVVVWRTDQGTCLTGEGRSFRARALAASQPSLQEGGTTHHHRPVNLERSQFRLRRWKGTAETWYLQDTAVVGHAVHACS